MTEPTRCEVCGAGGPLTYEAEEWQCAACLSALRGKEPEPVVVEPTTFDDLMSATWTVDKITDAGTLRLRPPKGTKMYGEDTAVFGSLYVRHDAWPGARVGSSAYVQVKFDAMEDTR